MIQKNLDYSTINNNTNTRLRNPDFKLLPRYLGLLLQLMASIGHWANMLISNREINGFDADPLEAGYVKFRAPKSDNLSLIYDRPESGLLAEARFQLTSGGETIPIKKNPLV